MLNCKVSTIGPSGAVSLFLPHQPRKALGLADFRRLSEPQLLSPLIHYPNTSSNFSQSTMSFLGSGSSPKSNEDIKTALLQQVQQEQAMNNARALIGVRHPFSPFSKDSLLSLRTQLT